MSLMNDIEYNKIKEECTIKNKIILDILGQTDKYIAFAIFFPDDMDYFFNMINPANLDNQKILYTAQNKVTIGSDSNKESYLSYDDKTNIVKLWLGTERFPQQALITDLTNFNLLEKAIEDFNIFFSEELNTHYVKQKIFIELNNWKELIFDDIEICVTELDYRPNDLKIVKRNLSAIFKTMLNNLPIDRHFWPKCYEYDTVCEKCKKKMETNETNCLYSNPLFKEFLRLKKQMLEVGDKLFSEM